MAIKITKTPENGYKYIPNSQMLEKEPFAVWIKPLPASVLLDLEDKMVQRLDDKVIIAQGLFSFKVLQQGLLNWENMTDAEGNAINYTPGFDGVLSDDDAARIPIDMISEIANIIVAITRDPSSVEVFFPEEK